MTILGSGIISLGGATVGRSVNLELSRSATASINMNESAVRTLAGAATGAISFSNFYSKSAFSTITYNFTTTVDGWTGTNATLTSNLGQLVVNATANDPIITSPVVSFNGGSAPIIRISILRTAGSGWDGSIYYTTAGHSVSEAYKALMPQPAWDGINYQIIEMNMSNLFAGGTDWSTNTITRVRLDFGGTAADDFRVEFIQIDTGITLSAGLFQYSHVGYFNEDTAFFTAPINEGATNGIDLNPVAETTSYQWLGYFLAPTTGNYTFTTTSDDASYMWIGNDATTGFTTANATVNNGGLHAPVTVTSSNISLTAGTYYPIRIQYGNNGIIGGANSMVFSFTGPGIVSTTDGTGYFLHNARTLGL